MNKPGLDLTSQLFAIFPDLELEYTGGSVWPLTGKQRHPLNPLTWIPVFVSSRFQMSFGLLRTGGSSSSVSAARSNLFGIPVGKVDGCKAIIISSALV